MRELLAKGGGAAAAAALQRTAPSAARSMRYHGHVHAALEEVGRFASENGSKAFSAGVLRARAWCRARRVMTLRAAHATKCHGMRALVMF